MGFRPSSPGSSGPSGSAGWHACDDVSCAAVSFDRDELIRILADAARNEPEILALWEGGSAAFGRVDHLSDADLHVVVTAGQVERAITAIRRPLSDRWGIAREYRRQTYAGDRQFFWQLAGVSPFNFVDMVFRECPEEGVSIDRGRHGSPLVHVDKCGCITVTSEPADEQRARLQKSLSHIKEFHWDLKIDLIRKYIRRGNSLHAFGAYQTGLIRPLVELLRIKYCPERSSHHLAHVQWDLPAEITARLEPLVMVSTLSDLEKSLSIVDEWTRDLLRELSTSLAAVV